MPEVMIYTPDRTARLVMGAWRTSALVYNSAGGDVRAERYIKRGGFIGLFQRYGWVATEADRLYVSVEFQGLRPGVAEGPLTREMSNLAANSTRVEASIWSVGILSVDIPLGAGPIGVSPIAAPSIEVDGVRVRAQGTLDGHPLQFDSITDGRFLE